MIGFSLLSVPIIGRAPFSAGDMVIQCGDLLPPDVTAKPRAGCVSMLNGILRKPL
jgi:hypothetical protein